MTREKTTRRHWEKWVAYFGGLGLVMIWAVVNNVEHWLMMLLIGLTLMILGLS